MREWEVEAGLECDRELLVEGGSHHIVEGCNHHLPRRFKHDLFDHGVPNTPHQHLGGDGIV